MMVRGNLKKILAGGLFVGGMLFVSTTTLTGCLTNDTKAADTATVVVDHSVKLTNEKMNDTVWNIMGPNHGAFDMVTGVTVAKATTDASKDAVDMSSLGSTSVTFPKTWTSLNTTMFVTAAAGFDYANASDSTVIKGYKAGTAAAITKVLAVNDIILAKLRSGNTYAVIKITGVVETSDDNKDYILFNYKLTP